MKYLQRKYRKFKLISGITFFLFLLLISIFYLSKSKVDKNFILGKSIIIQLKKNSLTDKELVDSIAYFVAKNFTTPKKPSVHEREFHELIKDKNGFCDEQASVFLSLCNYANLKGRLIFLYGADSISHHSIAEIYIDKWYSVDVFFEIKKNNSFLLPSIKSIIKNQFVINTFKFPKNSISYNDYYLLFDSTYPYRIVKYNQVKYSKIEKFYQNYLSFIISSKNFFF